MTIEAEELVKGCDSASTFHAVEMLRAYEHDRMADPFEQLQGTATIRLDWASLEREAVARTPFEWLLDWPRLVRPGLRTAIFAGVFVFPFVAFVVAHLCIDKALQGAGVIWTLTAFAVALSGVVLTCLAVYVFGRNLERLVEAGQHVRLRLALVATGGAVAETGFSMVGAVVLAFSVGGALCLAFTMSRFVGQPPIVAVDVGNERGLRLVHQSFVAIIDSPEKAKLLVKKYWKTDDAQLMSTDPNTLNAVGVALEKLGKADRAQRVYLCAYRMDSSNPLILHNLQVDAPTERIIMKLEADEIEQLKLPNGSDRYVAAHYADLLRQIRENTMSLSELPYPSDSETSNLMAVALELRGRRDEAEHQYARAVREFPSDAVTMVNFRRRLQEIGNYDVQRRDSATSGQSKE